MQKEFYPYSEIPFVRFIVPLISGILFYKFFEIKFQPSLIVIWLILLLLLLVIHFYIKKQYRLWSSILWGILLNIALFMLGVWLSAANYPKLKIQNSGNEKLLTVGKVIEKVKIKDKFIKLHVKISAVKAKGKWMEVNENTVVFLEKDNRSLTIQHGDELIFHSALSIPKSMGNPEEFDFSRYLFYHSISYQVYVKSGEWSWLSKKEKDFSIYQLAQNCREYFLTIIRKLNLSTDVFAITSAILLGYKNEIDEELKQAYASAGASHILAVSGLHVGVIYLIVQWLLFFMNRSKLLRFIQLVIILLFLFIKKVIILFPK